MSRVGCGAWRSSGGVERSSRPIAPVVLRHAPPPPRPRPGAALHVGSSAGPPPSPALTEGGHDAQLEGDVAAPREGDAVSVVAPGPGEAAAEGAAAAPRKQHQPSIAIVNVFLDQG